MPTTTKYPKAIWYIFGNKFCEQFSFSGLKGVLVLFLISIEKYDHVTAITIFHSLLVLTNITPFFGGILSDSYWGKYKTIYVLSIVNALGNIVVVLASVIISVDLQIQRLTTIVGLGLLAIGSGGMRSCVSAFGADQFVLPDQEALLNKYFAIYYFSVNAGSLIALFVSPELRKSVQCFGRDSCFPLAFGLPAFLMTVAIVLFVLGKSRYRMKKPESSIVVTSFRCMFNAIKNKITAPSNERKKKDWLEYADGKYGNQIIHDLRIALDVVVMLIPAPIMSTLNDQQGSSWVIQATLMNGKIDFLNWTLKPDQVHLLNPLLILIFIPFFETAVYPLLYKIGVNTPLRKITLGGSINALSFLCAAAVQYAIMGENAALSPNEVHLRIFNNIDCNVNVSNNFYGNFGIEPLDAFRIDYTQTTNETEVLSIDVDSGCYIDTSTIKHKISTSNGEVFSYLLRNTRDESVELRRLNELKKLNNGKANLRVLHDNFSYDKKIVLRGIDNKNGLSDIIIRLSSDLDQNHEIPVGTYHVIHHHNHERILNDVVFFPYSVNNLLIHESLNHTIAKLVTFEKGNYIHMLWQVPQVIIITIADPMMFVTLLEFSYTQAPMTMKSFIGSIYLFTKAMGNLLIIVFAKLKLYENQGHEFVFYVVLMTSSLAVFVLLSTKYKYKLITDKQSKAEQPFLNEDMDTS